MNSNRINTNKKLYLILLFLAAIVTLNYVFFVYPLYKELIIEEYNSIINGTALSPTRHRLLFTYILDAVYSPLFSLTKNQHSFALSFFFLSFCAYAFSFVCSYKLFKLFHTSIISLFLSVLLALSFMVGHYYHYANAWSMLEGGIFSLGFLYAYQQKKLPFLVVTIIAVLNRETGIFLAPAYLLANHSVKDIFKNPVAILKKPFDIAVPLIAVIAYILVRKLTGETNHSITISETFALNSTPYNLVLTAIRYALYFHVYLLLFVKTSTIPQFLKNQWPIVIVVAIFISLFGIWMEVRMFNSVLPLLLCMGGVGLNSLQEKTTPKP